MSALPFGLPAESIYAELRDLPSLIKMAWHQAQAFPDEADEILDAAAGQARHLCKITELHLRGAVERATRRENAAERATFAAERRIEFGLADIVRSLMDGELNPHGFYVYCLWGEDPDRPLYVGKSANIFARLGGHMSDVTRRSRTRRISVIRCRTARQMDVTEIRLINRYQPELNIIGIRTAS